MILASEYESASCESNIEESVVERRVRASGSVEVSILLKWRLWIDFLGFWWWLEMVKAMGMSSSRAMKSWRMTSAKR